MSSPRGSPSASPSPLGGRSSPASPQPTPWHESKPADTAESWFDDYDNNYNTPTRRPTPRPTYDYDTEFFVRNDGRFLQSARNLFLVYGIDSNVERFERGVLRACQGRTLSSSEEHAIRVEDDDMRRVWPRLFRGWVDIHQQQGFPDVNFTKCLTDGAKEVAAADADVMKVAGIVLGSLLALCILGFCCFRLFAEVSSDGGCEDCCDECSGACADCNEGAGACADSCADSCGGMCAGIGSCLTTCCCGVCLARERAHEEAESRAKQESLEREREEAEEARRFAAQDAAAAREIALGSGSGTTSYGAQQRAPIPVAMAIPVPPGDFYGGNVAKATAVTMV